MYCPRRARLLVRRLESEIKTHGIALGAFAALLHLWENDFLTQRELVDRLRIEQPTMAATLSRMEREGLIILQRDEGDARVQRIRLTESARELQDVAFASATRVNAKALADLSEDERLLLIRLLSRVIANLEAPLR